MPRRHVLIVSLSLALAAVAGAAALTSTIRLGHASATPAVSGAVIAKRNAQLARFEASLRTELRKSPPAVPKLPPVPRIAAAAASAPVAAPAVTAPAASAPQRVVYVRPAPIIVHKHRTGGEHDSEGADGGGGGGDD